MTSASADVVQPKAVKVSEDVKVAYYKDLDDLNLVPFWEKRSELVSFEPTTPCIPHQWRYADVIGRIKLLDKYIDVKGAERRALVLENPGLPGAAQVTKSLYASLQYVAPGEIEDSHRHVASAFRFVLEGTGAHTTVAGEKFYLAPRDVVLTPNMTWHEHGNETDSPMVMFDALDIPLVNHFGSSFKGLINGPHELTKPTGDGLARYGCGVIEVDHKPHNADIVSPMVHYPYKQVRSALERMRETNTRDRCHGIKVRYTNPTTGGDAFPTIGLYLQLIPKDFDPIPYRSTDESIFVVAEGTGRSVIGDREFRWEPNDVFIVPSWIHCKHYADEDAILFSCSDRPAQEKLGLWQEQRGNDPMTFD